MDAGVVSWAFGRRRSPRERRPRGSATGAHHAELPLSREQLSAHVGRVERLHKNLIAPRRCEGIAVVALPCI